MDARTSHAEQIHSFLQTTFHADHWTLTLPQGSGHQTYFAHSDNLRLFVKVGAHRERAAAMSDAGLSPPVLAEGVLDDDTPLIVQQFIEGRQPTRTDYREQMQQMAAIVRAMHDDERVRATLPPTEPSESHRDAAMNAMIRLRERWERYKGQVPLDARYVDAALDRLRAEIQQVGSTGLVVSHNDFCSPNLLLTSVGRVYVLDLEAMSCEDPACDLGAVLWWYYPPELWPRFLLAASYDDTPDLRERMRVRHAMHSLSIALPRDGSFDTFNPTLFGARLRDFRAVIQRTGNPEIDAP